MSAYTERHLTDHRLLEQNNKKFSSILFSGFNSHKMTLATCKSGQQERKSLEKRKKTTKTERKF